MSKTHPSNRIDEQNLDHAVFWHKPTPVKVQQYEHIANACRDFMLVILRTAPECADRSAALRAVREARMWANSAIALESEPEEIDHSRGTE